ncbi:hypothetical protein LPICM02_280105 [Pseudolactococcus piscium]|nr:hypothetical protein LPICM02_280105 [Lactococcus piscium]
MINLIIPLFDVKAYLLTGHVQKNVRIIPRLSKKQICMI